MSKFYIGFGSTVLEVTSMEFLALGLAKVREDKDTAIMCLAVILDRHEGLNEIAS